MAMSIFPASTLERSRMSLISADAGRELDLAGREGALGILGEQLGEDKEAVEGRP
jgi:hypothetical protein